MVKSVRVGPHGRLIYIDPQSRSTSTNSDAAAQAKCEHDNVPQGQILEDSGVVGDNGDQCCHE